MSTQTTYDLSAAHEETMMNDEHTRDTIADIKLVKHNTKTPWGAEHRKGEDGMYRTQVFDPDGETICTVAWYPVRTETGWTTPRPQIARLIAQAPAMQDEIVRLREENESLRENAQLKVERAKRVDRLNDEQQERIEALEEALTDLVSYAENAIMPNYEDVRDMKANIQRAKNLLNRQQAGGEDDRH